MELEDYAYGKATSRAKLLVGSFLGCGAGDTGLAACVNHREGNTTPHHGHGGDLSFPRKITSRVEERLKAEVFQVSTYDDPNQ